MALGFLIGVVSTFLFSALVVVALIAGGTTRRPRTRLAIVPTDDAPVPPSEWERIRRAAGIEQHRQVTDEGWAD